ncbi:MAG TPA: hypothetical protein VKA30_05095 [Actinomycetota bacterium]|nr:hypothetical protein [Actinomycetota bacterium]
MADRKRKRPRAKRGPEQLVDREGSADEALEPAFAPPEALDSDQSDIRSDDAIQTDAPFESAPPAPPAEEPTRRHRIRGRLAGVVALALLVALVGVVLQDQVGPRKPAAGAAGGGLSGAWLCPHGGGTGQRAWVAVTNPGTRAVPIRITTFGSKGVLAERSEVIPPFTQLIRQVPAKQAGTATEVEYFGGWAGAGWVVQQREPQTALASSRCAGGPSPTWYLPDLPTGRGQRASMVVMNPFAEDAVVNVTLRTDRRAAVRPGQLTALVVPAGTSRAIGVNRFLLQAPAERIVSGEVQVKVGRVVAGAVNSSSSGLASEVGVDDAASASNLPMAGVAASTLALLNPRQRRSDVTVVAQSDREQRVVSGVEGLSIGPDSAAAFPVTATFAGVAVQATNRARVAVERRAAGTNGDPALVGPAPVAGDRWLLLPTMGPGGGRALLVVQNPGQAPADVKVELLGPAGHLPGAPTSFRVAAGRAVVIELTGPSQDRPVSALVAATGGTIVVGGSSYGAGNAGFASTLAVPVPEIR